jgi:hypothetical protein
MGAGRASGEASGQTNRGWEHLGTGGAIASQLERLAFAAPAGGESGRGGHCVVTSDVLRTRGRPDALRLHRPGTGKLLLPAIIYPLESAGFSDPFGPKFVPLDPTARVRLRRADW